MKMRIRVLRQAQGLSQVQVADALGISPPAVCKWETGRAIPSGDKLPALATLFRCTIDDLYEQDARALPPDAAAS